MSEGREKEKEEEKEEVMEEDERDQDEEGIWCYECKNSFWGANVKVCVDNKHRLKRYGVVM